MFSYVPLLTSHLTLTSSVSYHDATLNLGNILQKDLGIAIEGKQNRIIFRHVVGALVIAYHEDILKNVVTYKIRLIHRSCNGIKNCSGAMDQVILKNIDLVLKPVIRRNDVLFFLRHCMS